ncbi:TatD family hydrolase [Streptomyces turgidiscabies]|uniref:Hydrolase, TatD family n=1 Tax=Streptomyces turgidiscabies (strain Car8) TaxID=698760 RepID=L7F625_STRT8|nr:MULTISPECIES: TatD family hydrolase [Streptomyces]ELP66486.1 hydrolase, TatD family [Streptomyces turgidiscabies Car8]MDX3500029.1 TatD family hydrolase [Streptomyces turgidiscabies]GAQ73733.1 TatD related DNase [Streptomyces turgidiscabies]
MRIFDPHIHMTSRTTDDYKAMHAAGVRALVEPAFWLGQPRTHPASFTDYFDSLLGWEPYRAAQFGIRHYCTIGLNPKEAGDPRCLPVLDLLPRYLAKDGVVAVGEIGYDTVTDAEEFAFARQLELAAEHGLPALVHTPHRDKAGGTRRSLDVVRASGIDPALVVLDHLNEITVGEVADSGCWMGFSIYPDTKMTAERMVAVLKRFGTERVLVNSAADWGHSDPLLTRATADAMLAAGFDEDDVDLVLWRNPVTFYGQSGRLDLDGYNDTQAAGLFAGNSVARGGS